MIEGKGAARSIWQADIRLDGVRVPAENRLPGLSSFKDAGRVLTATRSTIAWAALGHAVAAYDAALTYTRQRTQFGRPLCSFQIVQDRLVKMLAEVTPCSSTACSSRASPRPAACRTPWPGWRR